MPDGCHVHTSTLVVLLFLVLRRSRAGRHSCYERGSWLKRTVLCYLVLVLSTTAVSGQQIYLTGTQHNEIWTANRDGSGSPTLLYDDAGAGGAGPVGIIAVLGEVNQLFYTGGNRDDIFTAPIDGSGTPEVLWDDTGNEHLGVTADPTTGTLYWTTQGGGAIRSASWDGTGIITEVYSGLSYFPVGITIDARTGTLYWTSVESHRILSGTIDGSTPRVLYRCQVRRFRRFFLSNMITSVGTLCE